MKADWKKEHVYHRRKSFKWWLKNNCVFIAIIIAICAVVALIFGYQVYNFQRVKNMEALLDRSSYDIHWKTGISDQDAEKLRQADPDFDWENTWDRERWRTNQESAKDKSSEYKAKQSWEAERRRKQNELELNRLKARQGAGLVR